MHNRTRVIAAAAITAALAAGSTAAAVASTTGAKPGAPAKTVSASGKAVPASGKCTTDSDLAAQLGVSTARLSQAGVAVKTALAKGSGDVTQEQFDAALARALGIAQARVHQVLAAAGDTCGSGPGGAKPGGPGPDAGRAQAAFIAAVGRNLNVSAARVSAVLAPMLAAGHIDPSTPAFAAAARSLGVSTTQLTDALTHAKESLTGGK
jgi:hypothetical protein